jgi:hypothetical protein
VLQENASVSLLSPEICAKVFLWIDVTWISVMGERVLKPENFYYGNLLILLP